MARRVVGAVEGLQELDDQAPPRREVHGRHPADRRSGQVQPGAVPEAFDRQGDPRNRGEHHRGRRAHPASHHQGALRADDQYPRLSLDRGVQRGPDQEGGRRQPAHRAGGERPVQVRPPQARAGGAARGERSVLGGQAPRSDRHQPALPGSVRAGARARERRRGPDLPGSAPGGRAPGPESEAHRVHPAHRAGDLDVSQHPEGAIQGQAGAAGPLPRHRPGRDREEHLRGDRAAAALAGAGRQLRLHRGPRPLRLRPGEGQTAPARRGPADAHLHGAPHPGPLSPERPGARGDPGLPQAGRRDHEDHGPRVGHALAAGGPARRPEPGAGRVLRLALGERRHRQRDPGLRLAVLAPGRQQPLLLQERGVRSAARAGAGRARSQEAPRRPLAHAGDPDGGRPRRSSSTASPRSGRRGRASRDSTGIRSNRSTPCTAPTSTTERARRVPRCCASA